MPPISFIELKKPWKAAMPSSRSDLQIFPRQAGYPDTNSVSSSDGTTGLLQAAAADSVSEGLASLPQDLHGQKCRPGCAASSSRAANTASGEAL